MKKVLAPGVKHLEAKDTVGEARKVLEADAQAKRQAFIDAYQTLCKQHGMELIATAQFGIQPLRG